MLLTSDLTWIIRLYCYLFISYKGRNKVAHYVSYFRELKVVTRYGHKYKEQTCVFKQNKKIPQKVKTWENIVFFKEMAVAHSIFTLGGWVQLFWTYFDMPMTGVPLKVALGYKKNCFLGISKK